MAKEKPKIEDSRDEELDIAKATEIMRDYMRSIIGNLLASQFKLENIDKNGTNTRYIGICSVIPDIGKERDYYFMKVDVKTGKIVPPVGKGKRATDGKITFEKIDIDPTWLE